MYVYCHGTLLRVSHKPFEFGSMMNSVCFHWAKFSSKQLCVLRHANPAEATGQRKWAEQRIVNLGNVWTCNVNFEEFDTIIVQPVMGSVITIQEAFSSRRQRPWRWDLRKPEGIASGGLPVIEFTNDSGSVVERFY